MTIRDSESSADSSRDLLPPKFYKWLFIGIFAFGESATLLIDLVYWSRGASTTRSAVIDFLVFTALFLILILPTYYLLKRVLVKYILKFNELADLLPEIVFEMDLEGNLLYVSMSAFTLQGYTQEEFEKGMTATDVLTDWERSLTDLKTRVDKNIKEASGEYTARRKNGTTFPVIISSRLVYDGDRVIGISGVVTDITEQKKTEEELRRMNAELDGYARTVSHDLKNPISNVSFGCGILQNLLDLPLTDENITYIKEVAEAIVDGSAKATALIDELLLLAESGQVPKEVENVDVSEEVRSIITDKSPQADGVRFNTNDLGTVVASRTHVFQIFSNLIRNAVRFAGGGEPRIDILRLSSEEDSVHRFLVRDNGPGIPEEIIDKIFIPFTKDSDRGETGIGLSIVERVVKVYGGEIRTYNDNGACFEFSLKDYEQ
jgi:PAS domain S-box-containing protein